MAHLPEQKYFDEQDEQFRALMDLDQHEHEYRKQLEIEEFKATQAQADKLAKKAKQHAAKRAGYTSYASVSATISPQVSVGGAETPRKSMSKAVQEPKDTALIEFAKQVITHE